MGARFASSAPSSCCRRRGARAFTLIEVMVALVVAGLLAGVAVPAYSDYVRRSQLPEAFGALAEFRVRMEQYYQDHQNYGTGGGSCADGDSAPRGSWMHFAPAAAQSFNYRCVATADQRGYLVTATGKSGTPAAGHVFTIDHNGEHRTRAFRDNAVDARCWLSARSTC